MRQRWSVWKHEDSVVLKETGGGWGGGWSSTSASTGSFIQSQTSLTFINTVLILSSNWINRSHKVEGSGSIREKTSKTKKAAVRRPSCYLSVSSCLCSILPCLSFSFLSAPPCYEAIVWIFMKSDPYQQKTSSLRNLSPAAFTITPPLQASILFSFTQLHCSLLSTSLYPALFLYLHLRNLFLMAFPSLSGPALSSYLWKVLAVTGAHRCANRMLQHGALDACCQK